jgi:hypothetical protein
VLNRCGPTAGYEYGDGVYSHAQERFGLCRTPVTGKSSQSGELGGRDGLERMPGSKRRTRFDLNDNKRRPLAGNDVNFSRAAPPITVNDLIPARDEVVTRNLFSALAQ